MLCGPCWPTLALKKMHILDGNMIHKSVLLSAVQFGGNPPFTGLYNDKPSTVWHPWYLQNHVVQCGQFGQWISLGFEILKNTSYELYQPTQQGWQFVFWAGITYPPYHGSCFCQVMWYTQEWTSQLRMVEIRPISGIAFGKGWELVQNPLRPS
jgi:hypothetical protein